MFNIPAARSQGGYKELLIINNTIDNDSAFSIDYVIDSYLTVINKWILL